MKLSARMYVVMLCCVMLSAVATCGCAHHTSASSHNTTVASKIADDGGEYCTGVARPPWVPKPNMEHPDFIYATGVVLQATSRREGRSAAFMDGANQISKGLCSDIELKQDYLEAEYCERHGKGVDYYVLVALPRAQYEALQRQCAHTVIIGGTCAGCPDDEWLNTLAGTVSQKGQSLVSRRLSPKETTLLLQGNHAAAVSIGKRDQAVVAVTAELTPEKQAVEDDIHYVYLRAELRIIDLQSGAVLHSMAVPAVKGAAFDSPAAWKKAMHLVMQELKNRLQEIRI